MKTNANSSHWCDARLLNAVYLHYQRVHTCIFKTYSRKMYAEVKAEEKFLWIFCNFVIRDLLLVRTSSSWLEPGGRWAQTDLLISVSSKTELIITSVSVPLPGPGHRGGLPGCRSCCGSGLDSRGEVPDEPRCAAVLQQCGHGLHRLPAAG